MKGARVTFNCFLRVVIYGLPKPNTDSTMIMGFLRVVIYGLPKP